MEHMFPSGPQEKKKKRSCRCRSSSVSGTDGKTHGVANEPAVPLDGPATQAGGLSQNSEVMEGGVDGWRGW